MFLLKITFFRVILFIAFKLLLSAKTRDNVDRHGRDPDVNHTPDAERPS